MEKHRIIQEKAQKIMGHDSAKVCPIQP